MVTLEDIMVGVSDPWEGTNNGDNDGNIGDYASRDDGFVIGGCMNTQVNDSKDEPAQSKNPRKKESSARLRGIVANAYTYPDTAHPE